MNMTQGQWRREAKNGINVIFIHGINSSEDCWKHKNGSCWPNLLRDESELADIGIYIFSYRTGINTGSYSLSDIVDSLREYFLLDGLISSTGVVFVCHSMGGIVTRRFLVNQHSLLIKRGLNNIGLFLVASPSLGSGYANMLGIVASVMGHTQASALRFSQSNVWLNDLDKDFINLITNKDLQIKGKELVEDLPLYGKGFIRKQIVEPFSGAKYFGNSFKVPGSDHSTIATPANRDSVQHRLLVQFIKDFFQEEVKAIKADETQRHKAEEQEQIISKNISNIYIERPPNEDKCYNEVLQPGALIRIKAPQKMGKTLLLERILNYARGQGYQTAKLDLKLAEAEVLAELKTFLQWLCVNVADSLDLEPQLDKHWLDVFRLNKNCTRYFQKYLLSVTSTPLVLAIDNFELLFKCHEIFPSFCMLLRAWYEAAKQGDKIGNIWKKLRLVVVYSTELYPTLDTNHSPFNVGLPIELLEFKLQQVLELANQNQLTVLEESLSQLMSMVGGHPYLIQQAIAHLQNYQVTLEELLRLAPTEQGIFSDHLRQQLWHLQNNPQLESEYKRVVVMNAPIKLDTEIAFKLHSLGLVKFISNDSVPSCDLYRQYFSNRLG